MYHKYGNHISKQDHENNSGQDTGKPIDDHIPRSGINFGIVSCYEKLCQIVNVKSKILLDHVVCFILQLLSPIPQFSAAAGDLIYGIRVIYDPFPEILQIRQGILRIVQGILQLDIDTAALCRQTFQFFLIIIGGQIYGDIAFFKLCFHHIDQCIHHSIRAIHYGFTGGIEGTQSAKQLLAADGGFPDSFRICLHTIQELCYRVQLALYGGQLCCHLRISHLCEHYRHLIQFLAVAIRRQSGKRNPGSTKLCLQLFIYHSKNGIENSIRSLIQGITVCSDLSHSHDQFATAVGSRIDTIRIRFDAILILLQCLQRFFCLLQILPYRCSISMRIGNHGIQLLLVI